MTTGDIYNGMFTDDVFNGPGKYSWQDGAYYEGNFKDGLYHGEGTMVESSGDVEYSGEWYEETYKIFNKKYRVSIPKNKKEKSKILGKIKNLF